MTLAHDRLTENRRTLLHFELLALADAEIGDDQALIEHATLGASSAWDSHPGQFVSAILENRLQDLGLRHRVNASPKRPKRPKKQRKRVLHVLTQAYLTGGHTRVTWRWMQLDREKEHTVLLTDQSVVPIPEPLSTWADKLIVLNYESKFDRFKAIASVLADYDLVILNVHPNDAATVAACSAVPGRPRTLLFNHADHVFWLGVSAADEIINFRPSSIALTEQRRSAEPGVSLMLPLPLDEPDLQSGDGQALRSDLGISMKAPVSLLMAEAYKLIDDTGCHVGRLLRRLLLEQPDLHHIGIGQNSQQMYWSDLAQEFPTRVHLLGRTPDYLPALSAANIFLDSWPFSSITSALEAVSWGVPVLGFAPGPPNPLRFDDLGVEPYWATNDDDWIATAKNWISDPELATAIGEAMRSACLTVHSPAAWMKQLGDLLDSPWTRSWVIEIPDPVPADGLDQAVERLGRIRRDVA